MDGPDRMWLASCFYYVRGPLSKFRVDRVGVAQTKLQHFSFFIYFSRHRRFVLSKIPWAGYFVKFTTGKR